MNYVQTDMGQYKTLPEFFSRETCKDDIRKLLDKSGHILEREGILDQIIKLEDWAHARGGHEATTGITCLRELRGRLNQKADDLIRLEGEGGLPATPAQEQEIAELTRVIKRIDHMLCLIEGKPII